jgi:hypothetical protein
MISILLFTTGCRNHRDVKSATIPENLIPMDSMVAILVDVQLIEAILKINYAAKSENQTYSEKYYDYLFEKHCITKDQFEKSLEYYQRNSESLGIIYTEVITELSKLQTK